MCQNEKQLINFKSMLALILYFNFSSKAMIIIEATVIRKEKQPGSCLFTEWTDALAHKNRATKYFKRKKKIPTLSKCRGI